MKKQFISIAAVAAVALAWNAGAQSKPSSQQPPSIPKVAVTQPQLTTVTNWDEYPGHLEAVESVEIRPRVTGYLESIHFQDGAEVKAGDLLFVIDPKPYQAELDRATAERQSAETRLELARNDLQRAETLLASKAISDEEHDIRAKAVRQAEAALNAARAGETSAQINLDYTQIKAPITGRIGRRAITPGNLVQTQGGSGATLLATIVSLSPIYCVFDANESSFLAYRKTAGSAGRLEPGKLGCALTLGGDRTQTANGWIDFFDNQVNPRTGTIRMRAIFANEDRALMPGLFANIRLPAGAPQQVLLIPEIVINSDQGRKSVLVIGPKGTVEVRPIKTDRAHGTMMAVTEGLTPEDRVIVNGMMMMIPRPGMPVEALPSGGSAAAPVAPSADASAPSKEEPKKQP